MKQSSHVEAKKKNKSKKTKTNQTKATSKYQNQKMHSIHCISRRCPVTSEEGGPQYR